MLKVGDVVKVRGDLKAEWYGDVRCVLKMLEYGGKEATIVCEDFHHKGWYEIDLDDGMWAWSREMFEPVEIISKDEFERFMRS